MSCILIIEDNERNAYLARFLLEKRGCVVHEARDAKTGILAAQSLLPDIVVLDIQLPEMDGYEVTRRLRRIRELATTPIIAVTSHAMPGDRDKALEAGCNAYVEKPIEPLRFADQVLALLPVRP